MNGCFFCLFFVFVFFFTFNTIRSVHCKDRLHRVETPSKFRNKSDQLGDGGRVGVIGIG